MAPAAYEQAGGALGSWESRIVSSGCNAALPGFGNVDVVYDSGHGQAVDRVSCQPCGACALNYKCRLGTRRTATSSRSARITLDLLSFFFWRGASGAVAHVRRVPAQQLRPMVRVS